MKYLLCGLRDSYIPSFTTDTGRSRQPPFKRKPTPPAWGRMEPDDIRAWMRETIATFNNLMPMDPHPYGRSSTHSPLHAPTHAQFVFWGPVSPVPDGVVGGLADGNMWCEAEALVSLPQVPCLYGICLGILRVAPISPCMKATS